MEENTWENEMEKLSIDELKKEISQYDIKLIFLRNLKREKELEEFNWGGHYLKVYGCNGDGPEYINCERCKLDVSNMHSEPHIWFHGVGFSSEFGPYDDSNYVHFTTWDDHYLCYRFWEEKETLRRNGKINEGDYDWDSYKVEVITKEEFEKAFNEMIDKLKYTFNIWKEDYGNCDGQKG